MRITAQDDLTELYYAMLDHYDWVHGISKIGNTYQITLGFMGGTQEYFYDLVLREQ